MRLPREASQAGWAGSARIEQLAPEIFAHVIDQSDLRDDNFGDYRRLRDLTHVSKTFRAQIESCRPRFAARTLTRQALYFGMDEAPSSDHLRDRLEQAVARSGHFELDLRNAFVDFARHGSEQYVPDAELRDGRREILQYLRQFARHFFCRYRAPKQLDDPLAPITQTQLEACGQIRTVGHLLANFRYDIRGNTIEPNYQALIDARRADACAALYKLTGAQALGAWPSSQRLNAKTDDRYLIEMETRHIVARRLEKLIDALMPSLPSVHTFSLEQIRTPDLYDLYMHAKGRYGPPQPARSQNLACDPVAWPFVSSFTLQKERLLSVVGANPQTALRAVRIIGTPDVRPIFFWAAWQRWAPRMEELWLEQFYTQDIAPLSIAPLWCAMWQSETMQVERPPLVSLKRATIVSEANQRQPFIGGDPFYSAGQEFALLPGRIDHLRIRFTGNGEKTGFYKTHRDISRLELWFPKPYKVARPSALPAYIVSRVQAGPTVLKLLDTFETYSSKRMSEVSLNWFDPVEPEELSEQPLQTSTGLAQRLNARFDLSAPRDRTATAEDPAKRQNASGFAWGVDSPPSPQLNLRQSRVLVRRKSAATEQGLV